MSRWGQLPACVLGTLGVGALLAGVAAKAQQGAAPGAKPVAVRKVDFNRDVLPILSEHCFRCHGPDAATVAAGLRLDSFATATADRGGYRAITPGDPAKSLMYKRVSAKEDSMRMPPVGSPVAALTPEQQETVRLWIASGAEYKAYWAFVPPKEARLPKVSDLAWPREPIDYYVMAKLDEAGLKPAPEADRTTLARRASLTLTGLPPAPGELEAYLKDTKKGAYERYVDRLLASPRYGENQARFWLDAVRYADTHGLHIDNERAIYPYRDWVVRAFNADLPYDKFALWQVAGDLLPNPTPDQLIATGFVRLNPTTNEGGAIEEEFLVKNTMDRTDTFGTVFLGFTVGCAKCHDHKYDPIKQSEYYSLYAYFNSTADSPLDGNLNAPPPAIKAPTPEQASALAGLRTERGAIEKRVNRARALAWLEEAWVPDPKAGAWQVSGVYQASDFDAAFATAFDPEVPERAGAVVWKDVDVKLGVQQTGFIGKDNAAVYLRTVLTSDADREVTLRLGSDDGVALWVNGKSAHSNKVLRAITAAADTVKIALKKGDNSILVKIVNAGGGDGIYFAFGDARSDRIGKAAALGKKGSRTPEEEELFRSTYLTFGPDTADKTKFLALATQIKSLEDSLPLTIVAQEMPTPRETHRLNRGQYDQPKEVVQRGIPKALGSLPPGAPNNRLGLAQWLVSDGDPLFARVYVNRVWQQHFGRAIVKTAENFGKQGDYPTDPDLLDCLAAEFKKRGYSVKKLDRMIVTSATFRQSSAVTAENLAKDPENVLNSRGPRFRLDAEVLRDLALDVSGLLVNKLGGRGVHPYQPPGLWEAVAYPISDTAKYVQDHGEALYRRSLYLFWKRTSPPPSMAVFDAPSREQCVVNRSRTNTPLQALVGMNSPQFMEAARTMAEQVLLATRDDRSRVALAFRLATCRDATPKEAAIVLETLGKQKLAFAADAGSAAKLLAVGEAPRNESLDPVEHAAWTMVCNMLLNLDEVVTQH